MEDASAVPPAVVRVAKTMKKGERVALQVAPKYAARPGEVQRSEVTIDLELVSWKTVKRLLPLLPSVLPKSFDG